SAKQIAEFINGEVIGDENRGIYTFAKIEEGIPGALSFLANPKYESYLYTTKSSIVLVNKDFTPRQEVSATLIKVDNAYESLARLLALYESMKPKKSGVDPLASVAATARLGENVYIGPFAVVGENVTIGDNSCIHPHVSLGDNSSVGSNTILYPHVTIYHECRIGNNCVIHSGAVIGADGFGFAPTPQGYEKIPQIGVVIIEDHVEIGANTCVDRATMGATVIKTGVKLDNLIQIAHNDEIGSHTVMAAQVGIAGSVKVGEWCMFGGQVGLGGHITIGDKTALGAKAGLIRNVKSGESLLGAPAIDMKQFFKASTVFKRLPEMQLELHNLQKEINQLKQLLNK
ncbi:MAG: UDP-3-O-(3-hydroxymyristoyl)glucosamine N-acyltransferase, partial [Bacteroides sp.]|nr:UDP-3-O-(3-hydroxymyristoyl)glucosamine N-acyltransferase [Bacteroides sp.]